MILNSLVKISNLISTRSFQKRHSSIAGNEPSLGEGVRQTRILALAPEPLQPAVLVQNHNVGLPTIRGQDDLVRVNLFKKIKWIGSWWPVHGSIVMSKYGKKISKINYEYFAMY